MLKVHVQRLGDVTILCLQGRVVIGYISALANAVNSQSDVSSVVLDFSRVSRVDARGLGALLELREQAQSKGINFKLMNVTNLIQQVLELTCLNAVFEISTEQDVLSSVARFLPAEVMRIVPCAEAA